MKPLGGAAAVREVSTLERNYEILAKEWASHKTPFCNVFFALLSFAKESSKKTLSQANYFPLLSPAILSASGVT